MAFIVKRFPTLAVNIFNNLDDQPLVNFKDANRENYAYIPGMVPTKLLTNN